MFTFQTCVKTRTKSQTDDLMVIYVFQNEQVAGGRRGAKCLEINLLLQWEASTEVGKRRGHVPHVKDAEVIFLHVKRQ